MTAIDLGLGVLDRQLIDVEGRRCGKVDDLELEGLGEDRPRVAVILTGAPAWRGRGWLGRIAAALVRRGSTVRVDWAEVRAVEAAVHLRRKAEDLRLGRGELPARRLIEKLPRPR
jgi:sporulation protein YlmC with PRC-barrel domain